MPVKSGVHLPPWGPFVNIRMDLPLMVPCQNLRYVLTIVCMLSGWLESCTCRKDDAITECKKRLHHYVPRFGLPIRINNNRELHFI